MDFFIQRLFITFVYLKIKKMSSKIVKILIALAISLPLISWDADPKLAPYMFKYLDSLSRQPGTFIIRHGDTTKVWYIENRIAKTCTIITAPFHIKCAQKESEQTPVNKN
jgi:hypothetical protein